MVVRNKKNWTHTTNSSKSKSGHLDILCQLLMTPLWHRVVSGHARITDYKTVGVKKSTNGSKVSSLKSIKASMVCVDQPPSADITCHDEVEFVLVVFVENEHMGTKHVEAHNERYATFTQCEAAKRELQNEMNRIRFQHDCAVRCKTGVWDNLPYHDKLYYAFDRHVPPPPIVKTKAELGREREKTNRKRLPKRRRQEEDASMPPPPPQKKTRADDTYDMADFVGWSLDDENDDESWMLDVDCVDLDEPRGIVIDG